MNAKLLNLVITGGAALALLAGSQPVFQAHAAPTPPQPACETFSATGKQLCGRFLTYWSGHGGLAQQGYPISNEMKETSEVDGKSYTVQYFERAVFELHPENKEPYDVLLSLLGTAAYKQKYQDKAAEVPSDPSDPGVVFPQTGKTVKGAFLEYWKSHGGVAQQGYPISNLVRERSELDGKEYTMQYFERAVFESHPEKSPPYNVLLSQLGTMKYSSKYGGNNPPPSSTLAVGTWGGNHAIMGVTAGGVHIEFDCAHAEIAGPISISNGRIDVMGTYFQEHGGPTYAGDDQNGVPAHFTGTITGNIVTLTVAIPPGPTANAGSVNTTFGPYTMTLGVRGIVVKCL